MKPNKQPIYHEWKKISWKKILLFWTCFFLVVDILIAILFVVLGDNPLGEILSSWNYWGSLIAIDGAIMIGYLMLHRYSGEREARSQNDLEDSHWLSIRELQRLPKEFTVATWEEKFNLDDETVIGAYTLKNGVLQVVSTSQQHVMISGVTGVGKGRYYLDQNIAGLSISKTKPSLIITDPKQELYNLHAKQLEARGYTVSILNLRKPFSSQRWNPMSVLIRRIQMIKEIRDRPENLGDGRYRAAGEVFLSRRDMEIRGQELENELYENTMDLVYTLCTVKNVQQPTWEQGARDLIFALILAFCEDCVKGKLEEDQLQIFNVYYNITKYCDEDCTALRKYLMEDRDKYSKVPGLAKTVLLTSERTLTSYLSEVNQYMQKLADDGILSMMSGQEIDILNLDEKPNAVFVVVPDERDTRYVFVTLFITQCYKELVEKANLNERRKETNDIVLKRKTHFLLDEFGQLPKIDKFAQLLAVGRSRGIRVQCILQSFAQLDAVYGADVANTIKDNCPVKIFLGTDDPNTRKLFSDLCGNRKTKNFSVNTNVENPASSNTGATTVPLITPGELEKFNGEEKGNVIVSVRGHHPIWLKFTASFELPEIYFPEGKTSAADIPSRLFDKDEIVFDISSDSKHSEDSEIYDVASKIVDSKVKDIQANRSQRTRSLDEKWQAEKDEIEKKVDTVCELIDETDAETIREAEIRDKANLLYILMEQYAESISQKMKSVADYITSEGLPRLLDLKKQAIKQ